MSCPSRTFSRVKIRCTLYRFAFLRMSFNSYWDKKIRKLLTRTLAGWIHRYACGTSANGRFAFFLSRTLVTNGQLLFCSTMFVENFLAVLLLVSVCLSVVKGCPSVLKRLVYFRENYKDKIRWYSWPNPNVLVKVEFDNLYIFLTATVPEHE